MDNIAKTNGLSGMSPFSGGSGTTKKMDFTRIHLPDDSVSLGNNPGMGQSSGIPVSLQASLSGSLSTSEVPTLGVPSTGSGSSVVESAKISGSSADTKLADLISNLPYVEPDLDHNDIDENRYIPGEESVLVETKSTLDDIRTLTFFKEMGRPVWLEGPTGCGKTAKIEYMAHIAEFPLRRANLHDITDTTELIGGYKPFNGDPQLTRDDITDWPNFLKSLQNPDTKEKQQIWKMLGEYSRELISGLDPDKPLSAYTKHQVVKSLNMCINARNFHDPSVFKSENVSNPTLKEQLESGVDTSNMNLYERRLFNRHLMESVFPMDVLGVDQKKGRPVWSDGIVVDAVLNDHWLLLDEFTFAEPGIMERMNSLLEGDKLILTEKGGEVIDPSPESWISCTSNPATYSSRKDMSKALSNRLKKVQIRAIPPQEMVEIIARKSSLAPETLLQMTKFHSAISEMADHNLIGKIDGPYPFTIRDLMKWSSRIEHFKDKIPEMSVGQIIWQEARHIYQDRCSQPADREKIEKALELEFGAASKPVEREKKIVVGTDSVKIGDVELPINKKGGPFVPKVRFTATPSTVATLEKMAKCIAMNEPLLSVGETAAGKTFKTKVLAMLTNNNMLRFNMGLETDTNELIGSYKPTGKPGEYKWTNGLVLEAMENEYWILLDEYALTDPAVAERLNPLFEKGRTMVVTEKGNDVIKAKPGFRAMATTNPSSYEGRFEMSPAARNRFTEMWDPGITESSELMEVMGDFLKIHGNDPDMKREIAQKMVGLQDVITEKLERKELAGKQRESFLFTIRNLEWLTKFINKFSESYYEKALAQAKKTGASFNEAEERANALRRAFIDGAVSEYGTGFTDQADSDFIREFATKLYDTDISQLQKAGVSKP